MHQRRWTVPLGVWLVLTLILAGCTVRGGGRTSDDDDNDASDDDDAADDDDCPAGEVEDCNDNCADEAWLGDGFCDDGTEYETDFNCSEFEYDNGDCESGDDDDASDDDDDASDDDDDIQPCSPPMSFLNCSNPGPAVGDSAWEASTWSVSQDDCGSGFWAGAPQAWSLPSGVVSAYVGFTGGTGSDSALLWMQNGSTTLVNATTSTNAFDNLPGGGEVYGSHVAGAVMPMTSSTGPDSGCLVAWPATLQSSSSGDLLVTVRPSGSTNGLIQLNVGIVNGSDTTQEEMEAALYAAADLLYEGTGQAADFYEAWSFYTISDSSLAYVNSNGGPIDALRSATLGSDARSVNLFIISAFDDGILGTAGGIPGPLGHQGHANSGVVVAVEPHLNGDEFNVEYMALTIAHEVGHYVGLYHTSESSGSAWDPLPDTPQCSAAPITPSNCPDGGNLMFWTGGPADDQSEFSAEQTNVYVSTPVLY